MIRALRRQCLKRQCGIEWADPYNWLRNANDPAVKDYIASENRYAQTFMNRVSKLQRRLRAEMSSRMEKELPALPERFGNWLYYSHIPPGKEYAVYLRRYDPQKTWKSLWAKITGKGEPETLVDMNEAVESHDYAQLGAIKLSLDHRMVAYTLDLTGDEVFTLFIKDMKTGCIMHTIERVVSVEWANENTFYYTISNSSLRPYRVFLHTLDGGREDVLLYEDDDPKHFVDISKTKDWKYILINVNSYVTSEIFIVESRAPTTLQRVRQRTNGIQYFIEHMDGYFYILTNMGSSGNVTERGDYRLVRCSACDLCSQYWEELIVSKPGCWIEDMEVFKNHMVLYMRENGLPVVQILDLLKLSKGLSATECLRRLSLPELTTSITDRENTDIHSRVLQLSVSSPVLPHSTYEIDLAMGMKTLLQQAEIPGITTTSYTMKHCTATSHDGVQVPLTIVFAKNFNKNGDNPALLIGYGAYGHLQDMEFTTDRFSLLDRGWILAFAHVRGGGALGKSWHSDGKLLNKKNSFKDFIACARYLIEEKYASKNKIAAWGESAGGLLVAAAVNMEPELFRAIVLKVPFLDILNTMLDSSLSLTEPDFEEWGDPCRDEFFHYIREYSPYDNIKPGALYPAVLVTTSLNDTRVGYWEGAKWVAALRHSLEGKDCRPILLRTSLKGGHFGEGGRYERIKEIAYAYAFLIYNMQRK